MVNFTITAQSITSGDPRELPDEERVWDRPYRLGVPAGAE